MRQVAATDELMGARVDDGRRGMEQRASHAMFTLKEGRIASQGAKPDLGACPTPHQGTDNFSLYLGHVTTHVLLKYLNSRVAPKTGCDGLKHKGGSIDQSDYNS